MILSCSFGVSPSGDSSKRPLSYCSMRPLTRTMKNSSRFDSKIARNLMRSSRGFSGLAASSKTRPLNESQLDSRFRYRSAAGDKALIALPP